MKERDLLKKIGSLTISILLIILILFVLIPPATAVYVDPGTPSSSLVNKGTTITFHDANLTIRGAEKIPVNFLNFNIFNSNDQSVAWVNFSIDGTEIEDYPAGKFTVTRTTEIDSNWYGYGYRSGENESNHGNYDFGYGYGYGYGEDALTDITILYDITYITHTTGTFYAKLFVNASTHTYESDESTPFTVNYGGGGYSPSNPTPVAEAGGPYSGYVNALIIFDGSRSTETGGTITGYRWDWTNDGTYDTSWSISTTTTHTYTNAGAYTLKLQVKDNINNTDTDTATVTITLPPGTKVSQDILDTILTDYGISLTNPFYANDTNGDGAIDTFTDPNHKLTAIRFVNISDHASFLISTNEDNIPEFFWDTTSNTITPVDHSIGGIIDIVNNTDTKTITMTISVEKTNWIYIEVTDQYPDNPDLIVKTTDGRTISKEMIWREDGKVFILDDPLTEYLLIYSYAEGFLFDVILELTPNSVYVGEDISALITLINVGEPGLVNGTVEYALYKGGEIVWSSGENVS
ncbi:MAG: PKD domain-containing protein, partial [Thermoplasmata archaeon]|nr:PKD domain-containing protein [Thermoplasmata archaeon]